MELTELDATAQADLVRRGETSPPELVDAAIAAIEALDPRVGALVDTRFHRARDEARGPLPDGPFRGVPMLVKDGVQHSAGDRYHELVRRVEAGHGTFTPETALRLMDRGVAMKSNLHNVLFEPKTTRFWVANATSDKQPAADQPYHQFQLSELLSRKPDMQSPELPMLAQAQTGAASPPTPMTNDK